MSEQTPSDEITLKELIAKGMEWFQYFKSKWRIIMVGGVVGALLGFTIAYFDEPIYTAELTLALEEKGTGSSYAGLASQFGIDLAGASGGVFSGENTVELMKSRNIIEKALLTAVEIDGHKELLINRYITFNKWREQWEANRPDLAAITYAENDTRISFGLKKDSILYEVYKEIKKKYLLVEKPDKKLSIIRVTLKSKDELFSKCFTEVIVDAASNLYVQTKTQKSKKNLDLLENRLDSVKQELDKNISAAASTRDQNYNLIRAKGNVSLSQKQLNVQVLTTMYGELIKNTEMAKYSLMRDEPLVQVIDTPILPLEKKKKGKLIFLVLGGFSGSVILTIFLYLKKILNQIFEKFELYN